MAKTYDQWSSRARQLGWSPESYSMAAYQGTSHYQATKNQPQSTSRAKSVSSALPDDKPTSSSVYTTKGELYDSRRSGKIFGSNPNKSYEGTGSISGGTVGGNSVSDRNRVSIYMTKRGSRGIQGPGGEIFYETSPGSLNFRSVAGSDGGGFVTIEDFGAQKAEAAAAAAAASTGSGGSGGSGSRSSGSSSGTRSYAPASGGSTSSAAVNDAIEETETAVATAQADVSTVAKSPWPDAPPEVQTYDQYLAWRRAQSAKTGFQSTVQTGSTGLNDDEMNSGVLVTELS